MKWLKSLRKWPREIWIWRSGILPQDEIGDLARSINYMARQLKSNMESVISEKNRIQAILSSIADGVIAVDQLGEDYSN